ncbi:MAG: LLM class F420-dependent oxidoreductase [Acidimicrobiia bacterium]
MKLGYGMGYWSAGPPPGTLESVLEAERLGFDSAWTAEAYGSDALTPLAWYGSRTTRLRLGTGIAQMPARTPTALAMAAMTLDHLTGGRLVLGVGASGPQVAEGWYGQRYPKPLARSREYVAILRAAIARSDPIAHTGDHYTLPYTAADGTGLGKPLRSTIHPLRPHIPIVLGAEGPKNIALAAEIADGWLAMLYSPSQDGWYRERLAEGFARRAPDASPAEDFEVVSLVPAMVAPTTEEAADVLRPFIALYAGGMGARGANFHFEVIARLGYEAEATKIQDLYLSGRKTEAIAAVPTALVEDLALVGPPEKTRDDLEAWKETAITTMVISGPPPLLRVLAELVL